MTWNFERNNLTKIGSTSTQYIYKSYCPKVSVPDTQTYRHTDIQTGTHIHTHTIECSAKDVGKDIRS